MLPHQAKQSFLANGRFALRRQLGEGASGTVYEALDQHHQVRVALKVLRLPEPGAIHRFKQEFRALQGIIHPNLVRLGELIEDQGAWFFTMEYVRGTDFLSYIRMDTRASTAEPPGTPDITGHDRAVPDSRPRPLLSRGPASDRKLRHALAQLVIGLAALHRAGKIHRDIKPKNLLITPQGRLVIVDFGLATSLDIVSSSGATAGPVGTVAYMAPEQAAAEIITPAADWYAVGCVLYEALTGSPPFMGDNVQVLADKRAGPPCPPRARVAPGHVPEDLDALCVALLCRDPEARPPAAEIAMRLGLDAAVVAESRAARIETPTLFVGRDEELSALDAALASAQEGRVSLVHVVGESGTGKSALLGQLTSRARARGALVFTGRCYEHETVPYKALDGVVESIAAHIAGLDNADAAALVPADLPILARLFPAMRQVTITAELESARHHRHHPLGAAPALRRPQELRRRGFSALRELLGRLAERTTVVLAIDDMQWADDDSMHLLGELLCPPDPPPLFILLTARISAAELFSRVGAHTVLPLRELSLGPLADSAALELCRQLLASAPPGRDVDAALIAAEAQGHPLFLAELVRHATMAALAPERMTLDEVLWQRASALPEHARVVMSLIALARAPLSWGVLCLASAMRPEELDDALALLRGAGLIHGEPRRGEARFEPFHDRVRACMVARLDAETGGRYHRAIAVALERGAEAPSDFYALVHHYEHAGDIARAAKLAERAAEQAKTALAFDQAAALYRAALRLRGAPDAEARRLRIALADALVNAGQSASAAEEYLAAVPGPEDDDDDDNRDEQSLWQSRAVEHFFASGHIERGREVLDALAAEVNIAAYVSERHALAALVWDRARLRMRGLRWQRRSMSDIPPRMLYRLDIYQAISKLVTIDPIRAALFHTRALLSALDVGEPGRLARSLAQEAGFVAMEGRHNARRARRLMALAERIAESEGGRDAAAWVATGAAFIRMFEGRFAEGVTGGREAERLFRARHGANWEIATARFIQVWGMVVSGRFAELHGILGRFTREARLHGDRYADTTMRRYGNAVWLALDRVDDARRELSEASWPAPTDFFHAQHFYELRAKTEIALYTGEASAPLAEEGSLFARLRRSLLYRTQFVRAEARWLEARAALAAAEASGERVDMRKHRRRAAACARRLMRERIGYAAVWAALVEAAVAVQGGKPERAKALLRSAAKRADEHGMGLCAAAARWHLAQHADAGSEEQRACTEAAQTWMKAQGIARPERFVRIVAPGFGI